MGPKEAAGERLLQHEGPACTERRVWIAARLQNAASQLQRRMQGPQGGPCMRKAGMSTVARQLAAALMPITPSCLARLGCPPLVGCLQVLRQAVFIAIS